MNSTNRESGICIGGLSLEKKKCCYNFKKPYNDLMENIYVIGNKENYDWLMKGKSQLEHGQCSAHELFEVEDE